MKNSIFITFLLVMCFGCSNKKGGNHKANIDDTFITAKVDGVDFEVRGSLFAVTTTLGVVKSTLINAGYDDHSKSLSMGITNLKSTGTYSQLKPSKDAAAVTTTYVSSLIYGEEKTMWRISSFKTNVINTITITELNDTYVIGTFQFTGFDINSKTQKNIKEGRFKLKHLQVN